MKKIISLFFASLLLLPLSIEARKRSKHEVTVAVFAINDFHAGFVRNDYKHMPGAAAIWQTIDSLKQVYPYHLTVSAGDNFGGSYFYAATKGVLLPVFFDGLGLTVSALGNHEFDDGQAALQAKWVDSPLRPTNWGLDYVCANVRNVDGAIPAFAQPFAHRDIYVGKSKTLRIGIVGLLTANTPSQTSKSRIRGLSFDGRYTAVLDSVKRLPDYETSVENADIRLLLTHIGTKMQDGHPVWDDCDTLNLRSMNDPTWHGIFTSHTHESVCGTINQADYPIVQGASHGRIISVLKIRINTKTRRIIDVKAEQCPVRPDIKLSAGPARLQAQIDSLLIHTKTAGGAPLGEVLTHAPQTLVHNRANKWRQTLLGELVCRSYAEAARQSMNLPDNVPVVGVSHFGSIRSGITQGPVSVLDVGEVLPFSNALRIYELSGRQLRQLLNFGYHNQDYGWLQTSWLDVERDSENNIRSFAYVSPRGHRQVITDDTVCYISADEFLANGGDGYSTDFFPASQLVEARGLPATTDAFINYLKSLDELPRH